MKLPNNIWKVVSGIALVIAIGGAFIGADDRYAKADQMREVQSTLKQVSKNQSQRASMDLLTSTQMRIQFLLAQPTTAAQQSELTYLRTQEIKLKAQLGM